MQGSQGVVAKVLYSAPETLEDRASVATPHRTQSKTHSATVSLTHVPPTHSFTLSHLLSTHSLTLSLSLSLTFHSITISHTHIRTPHRQVKELESMIEQGQCANLKEEKAIMLVRNPPPLTRFTGVPRS